MPHTCFDIVAIDCINRFPFWVCTCFVSKTTKCIQELSLGTTLVPGDVVLTGTPPGVGFARTPPEYLQAGDVMELSIESIGTLTNPVVTYTR